ncbi:VanZ family protein [Actinomyces culturomici]|uniref:VanZ family protein n=1 Tax=Actinomyces culturomici TaxID=1926276 RepID=UPI00135B2F3D|nr:VanZ family protein [Actinomyces culturomici]
MPPWMTSMRLAPILLGVALLVFGLPSLLVDRRNRTGALLASVYGSIVLGYTLLPLPTAAAGAAAWCAAHVKRRQFIPGRALLDIWDAAASASTPLAVLWSHALLQVVFNILLFVPLGMLVRGRTGRGAGSALLAGALLSIGIETAQGTGLFGLYACAYRIVDVDDVAANALGALLGALLMSALLRRRAAPASSAGSLPT